VSPPTDSVPGDHGDQSDDPRGAKFCAKRASPAHKTSLLTVSPQVFAICYTDGERILASRDPLGVRPLFYTKFEDDDKKPGIAFASEIKALLQFGSQVHVFPPGHVYDSSVDQFVSWCEVLLLATKRAC